jgi:hypothetical protein
MIDSPCTEPDASDQSAIDALADALVGYAAFSEITKCRCFLEMPSLEKQQI